MWALGIHEESSIRREEAPTPRIERQQTLAIGRPLQELWGRPRRGTPEHLLRIRIDQLDATIRGREGEQVGTDSAWARAQGSSRDRLPGWCDASDVRLNPLIPCSVASDDP